MTIPRPAGRAAAALAILLACASTARPQNPEPLRLAGVYPAGVRGSLTDSWGTMRVEVANTGPDAREARVVVFYPQRPDARFARDLFVPGRSVVAAWLTIGPAPTEKGSPDQLQMLLIDRTGGRERVVLPPGEEKVRSRLSLYRRREVTTAVFGAEVAPDGTEAATDASDPVSLVRSMREAAGLSADVIIVSERFLPSGPEAFDGIDVLVIAGNRLAADPVGRQAVRRWVQQGGTVWVLLDRVAPATIAPLVGDDFDVEVIDRVGLSTVRLSRPGDLPALAEVADHDHPVELVRVVPGREDTVIHMANGWPASFTRPLGRGRVYFTTLGPRGWYRIRTRADFPSRFVIFPDTPIASHHLAYLGKRLHPSPDSPELPFDLLREMAAREVGYSVIGRTSAAAIFGGFVLGGVGLWFVLRRSRWSGLAGWLPPAAAVTVAVAFVVLGESSRRSLPATIGFVAVVDVASGTGEAAARGVAAVYRPNSGPVDLRSDRGARFELDTEGLEGKARDRVVTDLDEWHIEGLSLPAGVRTGRFRSTVRPARLSAVARFGPDGLTGQLDPGSFREPADGVTLTPNRDPLPARFEGNTFTVRAGDPRPPGQYLTAAVLSDQQQQRQTLYRRLFGESFPTHWENRNLLLAWAGWNDPPFRAGDNERIAGSALLVVPLEFEPTPPDTAVAIPAAFVSVARIVNGQPVRVPTSTTLPTEMDLRFQLPEAVLPMTVERARFTVRLLAPGRRVTVTGRTATGLVTLYDVKGPTEPVQVDITDPELLRPDRDGGLSLTFKIGEFVQAEKSEKVSTGGKPGQAVDPNATTETDWKIEYLGLEVVGRTAGR